MGERGTSQIPHQRLSRRRWADTWAQSPPALSLSRHGPATRDGPHQAGRKHQHHGGTRGMARETESPRAGTGSAMILPEPGVWLTYLNSQLLEKGARSAVCWRRAAPRTTKAPGVGGPQVAPGAAARLRVETGRKMECKGVTGAGRASRGLARHLVGLLHPARPGHGLCRNRLQPRTPVPPQPPSPGPAPVPQDPSGPSGASGPSRPVTWPRGPALLP